MFSVLIATLNRGKIVEIQSLLAPSPIGPALPPGLASPIRPCLPIRLVLPEELGLHLEVAEDGQTYAENAARKALAFCQASGLVTLADDSGLEVDALGGQPGIYSARYAPAHPRRGGFHTRPGSESDPAPHASTTRPGSKPRPSDADRRGYLLQQLAGKPRPWTARFCCTVAIATPEGRLEYREGFCSGEIIPTERGSSGFGYDPIFLLPELSLTMAELSLEQKNLLSHRGRAIQEAVPLLDEIFALQGGRTSHP